MKATFAIFVLLCEALCACGAFGQAARVPVAARDLRFSLSEDTLVAGSFVRLQWDAAALPSQRARWEFSGIIDTTLYLTEGDPEEALLRIDAATPPTLGSESAIVRYRFLDAPTSEVLATGELRIAVAPPLLWKTRSAGMNLHPGENELPLLLEVWDARIRRIEVLAALTDDLTHQVIATRQVSLSVQGRGAIALPLILSLPDSAAGAHSTLHLVALPDGSPPDLPLHAFFYDLTVQSHR